MIEGCLQLASKKSRGETKHRPKDTQRVNSLKGITKITKVDVKPVTNRANHLGYRRR